MRVADSCGPFPAAPEALEPTLPYETLPINEDEEEAAAAAADDGPTFDNDEDEKLLEETKKRQFKKKGLNPRADKGKAGAKAKKADE